MKLEDMSIQALLELHNSIAEKAAGPKTFATRSKLVERILQIAADRNIDLAAFRQPEQGQVSESETSTSIAATESTTALPNVKKKRGSGVGELACRLLLDPEGFPHATIAEMVNVTIPGSTTTDKSVRWYASKMRKEGIKVPARQPIRNDHIWVTDPEAAKQWLSGVSIATPTPAKQELC